MSDEAWKRDDIQFPRLIAELQGVLDKKQIEEVAASMDLEDGQVEELFYRAISRNERNKEYLPELPPDPSAVYGRIMQEANDNEYLVIKEVAERAGVIWKCTNETEPGQECRYANYTVARARPLSRSDSTSTTKFTEPSTEESFMGRNLITISYVGPKRIENPVAIKNAIEKVAKIYEYIDKVQALIEEDEKDEEFDLGAAIEGLGDPPKGVQDFYDQGYDENDLDKLKPEGQTPEKVVQTFIDLWHHKNSSRDLNWQTFTLPSGETWVCQWAGDTTYGDEPDGEGYALFLLVGYLDFYQLLGLQ